MKRKFYFAKAVLRTAGQSTQGKIKAWFLLAGIGIGFIFGCLLLFFISKMGFNIYKICIALSAIGCGIFAFCIGQIDKYCQGLEGEKRVREELEPLVKDGYYILDDVPGDKFNIDFLIIGPSGIYVIEVKNPRKYRDEKITYKNGQVFLGNRILRKNPVDEAKRHKDWVKKYLGNIKNQKINNIKPVVLFPNIMVEEDNNVSDDIWVLNPKRFRDYYLPKENKIFNLQEIDEIASIFKVRIYESTAKFDD